MVIAETTAAISLGDASVTDAASAAIIDALASQYNTSTVAATGAAVSVTLYQALSLTVTLASDMSDEQLCTVLTAALTLDAFEHTCVATSEGGGTTFVLEIPLEGHLAAVNDKTAEMKTFISDDSELLPNAMVAAAPSVRRRQLAAHQLATLEISAVEPPVTSLGALVTIVIQQLAAEAGSFAAVTESQEEVAAAAGNVDATRITNSITEALADSGVVVVGLAVAEPTVTVALTNAPPSVPPPASPPAPPAPPAPPPPASPPSLPPPSPPPNVPPASSPPTSPVSLPAPLSPSLTPPLASPSSPTALALDDGGSFAALAPIIGGVAGSAVFLCLLLAVTCYVNQRYCLHKSVGKSPKRMFDEQKSDRHDEQVVIRYGESPKV